MHKLLRMKREEFRDFLPLFALYGVTTGGFFVARTAKDALFFAEAGAKMLPLAFLINAVFVFLVGGWLARLEGRYALRTMMRWCWPIALVCAAAFGVVFFTVDKEHMGLPVYFALFAFFEIPSIFLTGFFWGFAGGYFTARQQDKIFPIVMSGGHLGTIVAGLIAALGAKRLGASGLLFVWAGTLLVGALLLAWLWRFQKPSCVKVEAGVAAEIANPEDMGLFKEVFEGFRAVARHKFAGLFAGVTLCAFFVASIFDYSLAETSVAVLGNDADQLAVYLGYIVIVFGFLAFFGQLFLMPGLIKKRGVGAAFLFPPAFLAAGSLLLLGSFTFLMAAAAKVLFYVNEFVFNQTLLPFIYAAVPKRDRTQARAMIEGTVTNGGLALAGVFLLLPSYAGGFFQVHWIGLAAFLAALVMLALSWFMRNEYDRIRKFLVQLSDSQTLAQRLRKLVGDKENGQVTLHLKRGLMSEQETEIVAALAIIRDLEWRPLAANVLQFVNHDSATIRLAALSTVAALVDDEHFTPFQERVVTSGEDGTARFLREDAATLEAIASVYLCARHPGQLGKDFAYLMQKEGIEPDARGVAIHHIFHTGALDHIRTATEVLEVAVASGDEAERRMSARVLGELGGEANVDTLVDWLGDEVSPQLQSEALQALARIGVTNPVVAERALDETLKRLDGKGAPDIALDGAARLLEEHQRLIVRIRSAWEEGETEDLRDALEGTAQLLPQVLARAASPEADVLLLDMVKDGEHQVARRAVAILEERIRNGLCDTTLSSMFSENGPYETLPGQLHEHLAWLGCLFHEQASASQDSADVLCGTLRLRMREMAHAYRVVRWISLRTPTNFSGLDRDMRGIESPDVVMRDDALKALEIKLGQTRHLYVELDDFADALDFQKTPGEQAEALKKLAERKGYECAREARQASLARLLKTRKDTWLLWAACADNDTQEDTPGAPGYLEPALAALRRTEVFSQVSAEHLAHLILRAEQVTCQPGERFIFEEDSRRGFPVVVEGQVSVFHKELYVDTLDAPVAEGYLDALASCPSTVSVRAANGPASGLFVEQAVLKAWLTEFQDAALAVSRNLSRNIGELYGEKSKRDAQQEHLKSASEKLDEINLGLHEILHGEKTAATATRQERYLVENIDLESLESVKGIAMATLEQFYLFVEMDKELRLRRKNGSACSMTLKGKKGSGRAEVTTVVAPKLFEDLKPSHLGEVISKRRYAFPEEGPYKGWSVDVFDSGSAFEGLVIAEIDIPKDETNLPEIHESVQLDACITHKTEYENRNLALYGRPDAIEQGLRNGLLDKLRASVASAFGKA